MKKNVIGYKIRLIHNQIHKIMEARRRENEGEGLTEMQRFTLCFLAEHEGNDVYQRDIETEFAVSRATASNMLQLMERKGLIARAAVEHDARLKKIVLTKAAWQLLERGRRDICAMEEQLVRGMTEAEIAQLLDYLERMLDNIGGRECEEDTGKGWKRTHNIVKSD